MMSNTKDYGREGCSVRRHALGWASGVLVVGSIMAGCSSAPHSTYFVLKPEFTTGFQRACDDMFILPVKDASGKRLFPLTSCYELEEPAWYAPSPEDVEEEIAVEGPEYVGQSLGYAAAIDSMQYAGQEWGVCVGPKGCFNRKFWLQQSPYGLDENLNPDPKTIAGLKDLGRQPPWE